MWLSPVECLVRDQEAAGSNPVTPMTVAIPKKSCDIFRKAFFVFVLIKLHIFLHYQNVPSRKIKCSGLS